MAPIWRSADRTRIQATSGIHDAWRSQSDRTSHVRSGDASNRPNASILTVWLFGLEPCYRRVRLGRSIDPESTEGRNDMSEPTTDSDRDRVASGVLFTPDWSRAIGAAPKRADAAGRPEVIDDAAIAWRDGDITFVGPAWALPSADRPANGIEVRVTGAVVPGFVDCHTHLPFVGWRADEFEARLSGQSYRDVQGRGWRDLPQLATAGRGHRRRGAGLLPPARGGDAEGTGPRRSR